MLRMSQDVAAVHRREGPVPLVLWYEVPEGRRFHLDETTTEDPLPPQIRGSREVNNATKNTGIERETTDDN